MQQITMRAVQLDHINAQPFRTLCRRNERVAHPVQTAAIECGWRVVVLVKWQIRWRYRLPAVRYGRRNLFAAIPRQVARRLSPGVCKLDRDGHIRMAAHRFQSAGHRRFGRIVVQTDIAIGDPSFGHDRRRFDRQQRRSR
ncbi:hypothetical protein BH09PSE3_BH09PSE3_25310 [soil metagenome]